ncbi:hypothetical protein pb186bvf_006485 [Paramecium bursaria]
MKIYIVFAFLIILTYFTRDFQITLEKQFICYQKDLFFIKLNNCITIAILFQDLQFSLLKMGQYFFDFDSVKSSLLN